MKSIYSTLRLMGILCLLMGIAALAGVYEMESWKETVLSGSLPLLIGTVMMFIVLRHDRKRKMLEREGLRVRARVTEIERKIFIHINHRSPYVVCAECIHPKQGWLIWVKSEFLTRRPRVAVGDEIDVLIDPEDESRYYIPIDGL